MAEEGKGGSGTPAGSGMFVRAFVGVLTVGTLAGGLLLTASGRLTLRDVQTLELIALGVALGTSYTVLGPSFGTSLSRLLGLQIRPPDSRRSIWDWFFLAFLVLLLVGAALTGALVWLSLRGGA